MLAQRLLSGIKNLHPGQLAVLWVGSVILAALLMHAHNSLNSRISRISTARLASITADKSYRDSYTPEQRVRADSFDAANMAQSYHVTQKLRVEVFLIELSLVLLAAGVLATSWLWFGGRKPALIAREPVEPSRRDPTRSPAQPLVQAPSFIRGILWVVWILLGLVLFRLGELLMLWIRSSR